MRNEGMKGTIMKISEILFRFCVVGAVGFASVRAQEQASETRTAGKPEFTVSLKASTWLSRKWDASSFRDGVTLLQNRTETIGSRAAALEELHVERGRLAPEEMRELLNEARLIATDRTESPLLSAHATRVMANMALTLEEKNLMTHEEAEKDASFLLEVAQDPARDLLFRAQAINGLGLLKVTTASPALRALLKDAASVNKPEIARPSCLALWRIEGNGALIPITEAMQTTTDATVFGMAAFTLGQIKEPESVAALVQNLGRFPNSGSCDAALVEMEDVILGVLRDPNHPDLAEAIRATRHLWKEGQSASYVPLLQQLLKTAPAEARRTALDRLLEYAGTLEFAKEKQELAAILTLISDQPQMDEYVQRIQRRVSATVLTPTRIGRTVPTPAASEGGN